MLGRCLFSRYDWESKSLDLMGLEGAAEGSVSGCDIAGGHPSLLLAFFINSPLAGASLRATDAEEDVEREGAPELTSSGRMESIAGRGGCVNGRCLPHVILFSL